MPISLSPEEKLLISLCRLEFSVEKKSAVYDLMREVTHWERFVDAANSHGVIALVHHNIQELGFFDLVPEAQRKKIHSGFLKSIARNSLISKIAGELDKIAGNENIRIVMLKGLALERTVYGNNGLRQMTDLDVLVAPNYAMKLRKAMQLNGFEAAPFISSIYEKKMFAEGKHLPELKKYGIDTEIHIRLFDQKGNSLTEKLIERSYKSDLYKNLVNPDPQLHFLFLVKHLCKHENEGSSQLRMYIDLALLLESDKGIILNEELLKYARSISLDEELKSRLNILNMFLGVPLPSFVKADNSVKEYFSQILRSPGKNLTHGDQSPLKPLKYVDGYLNKFLFVAGYIFPTARFLRHRYKNEKRKSLVLCYIKWWHAIILKITK
jgi:hypothetical protein